MADREQEFFDFIYNRQLIWHKRFMLKQKFPWTKDLTFQKYKILNVYRELDKGTQYIINKLSGIKDREIILLNIVFYRFFNQFNLYEKLFKQLASLPFLPKAVFLEIDPSQKLFLSQTAKKYLPLADIKFCRDFNNFWRYAEIVA